MVMRTASGPGESTARVSSTGFVNHVLRLTTGTSIATTASRYILTTLIMLYLMERNGFSVKGAKNGITLTVRREMVYRISKSYCLRSNRNAYSISVRVARKRSRD
jgi:hypothetical protein